MQLSSFKNAWRLATEPAASVTESTDRHQSRLLTAFLVVTMFLGTLSALIQLVFVPDFGSTFLIIMSAIGILGITYAATKRGHYRPASLVTCAAMAFGTYGAIIANPQDFLAFLFLFIPIILATILMEFTLALVVTALLLAGMIGAVAISNGGMPTAIHLSALLALSIVVVITLVLMRHRDRLEEIRQTRLAESEANLRALAENANDGIFVAVDGQIVFNNRRGADMLGYDSDEIADQTIRTFLHPDERDKVIDYYRARVAGKPAPSQYETTVVTKGDENIPVEVTAALTHWQGQRAGLAIIRDISARKLAERQMEILSRALEQAADSVLITNPQGIITYVNPSFESITGYTKSELLGRKPSILKSGKQGDSFYRELWSSILAGNVFSEVFVNKRKSGDLYYLEQTITPLRDEQGKLTNFVATGRDITERMAMQERLQYMAHHDPVTTLPNRTLFMDRLKQVLAHARRHDHMVAVIFLDLDRFKQINDSLGHEAGDRILMELGQRMARSLRSGDTVARFGGDEFVILLDQPSSQDDVTHTVTKLLKNLASPVMLGDEELYLTGSIGISCYPGDGEESRTLIKNADIAMLHAKRSGKNNFKFFVADMSAKATRQLGLETRLRKALEREEFLLHFQPIVNLITEQVVGAEALLRWNHAEQGILGPHEFIHILEETRLIIPVGEWVIQSACAQLAQWQIDSGNPHFRMAVNISGRQLSSSALPHIVDKALQTHSLHPYCLELEITETVLMENVDMTQSTLQLLKGIGTRLSIDDFGTGYSSLGYVKRFPVNTIKIDRSFTRDIMTDADDAAIVKATIAMAKSLNRNIIAEGVEKAEQLEFLRHHGCEEVQGYLFSAPTTAEDFVWDVREPSPPAHHNEEGAVAKHV